MQCLCPQHSPVEVHTPCVTVLGGGPLGDAQVMRVDPQGYKETQESPLAPSAK